MNAPLVHLFPEATRSLTPADRIALKARSSRVASQARLEHEARQEYERGRALLAQAREVVQRTEERAVVHHAPPEDAGHALDLRAIRARVEAGMAIPASAFE